MDKTPQEIYEEMVKTNEETQRRWTASLEEWEKLKVRMEESERQLRELGELLKNHPPSARQ